MESSNRTDSGDPRQKSANTGDTAAMTLSTAVPPTDSRIIRFSPNRLVSIPLGYCVSPYAIHIPDSAIPIWVFETEKSSVINGTTGLNASLTKYARVLNTRTVSRYCHRIGKPIVDWVSRRALLTRVEPERSMQMLCDR